MTESPLEERMGSAAFNQKPFRCGNDIRNVCKYVWIHQYREGHVVGSWLCPASVFGCGVEQHLGHHFPRFCHGEAGELHGLRDDVYPA